MSNQRKYSVDYSTSDDFWSDDSNVIDVEPAPIEPRSSLVLPAPIERQPVQDPVQAYPVAILPHSPSSVTSVEMRTTYRDRAVGFNIATLPVSVVAGFLGGIVAIVGFGVPALSLAVLVWIFTGFCATWLFAYLWHTLASPDGVALIHTVLGWLFLFGEQRHRHRGRK